jgi:hypothetical protein
MAHGNLVKTDHLDDSVSKSSDVVGGAESLSLEAGHVVEFIAKERSDSRGQPTFPS